MKNHCNLFHSKGCAECPEYKTSKSGKGKFFQNFQSVGCNFCAKDDQALYSNYVGQGLLARHVLSCNGKTSLPYIFRAKGDLISKTFFTLNPISKTGAKSLNPEYVQFRWIVLRIVIWHLFWEIGAKVKHFLRLSHLQIPKYATKQDFRI